MRNLNLVSFENLSNEQIIYLRKKASKGLQMLRLPRCGTTISRMAIENFTQTNFSTLGSSSFSNLPFSWGSYHQKTVNFPKDCTPDNILFLEKMKELRSIGGYGYTEGDSPLEKSWISDFNVNAKEKPGFDDEKLTFQIIRNPYDWLTSIYRWDFMKTRRDNNIENFNDYINFLFNSVSKNSSWNKKVQHPFPWPMHKRCFFQGFDDQGNCHVDVYIKYEHLKEGIEKLISLTGLCTAKHKIPLGNRTHPCNFDEIFEKKIFNHIFDKNTKVTNYLNFENYKKAYYNNKEIINIVKKAYKWDLENFNYDIKEKDNNPFLFVGNI